MNAGLSKGSYQLQIRLSEVDEVPGSSVSYADIRYAQNGLSFVGVPGNSPLLGENAEVEIVASEQRITPSRTLRTSATYCKRIVRPSALLAH